MNYIRQLVREEMAARILSEGINKNRPDVEPSMIQESIDMFEASLLEEGFGESIYRVVATALSGYIKGHTGGIIGAHAAVIPAYVIAGSLFNPIGLSILGGGWAIGAVWMGYKGGKEKYKEIYAKTGRDTEKLAKSLRKSIEARDKVLTQISKKPSEEFAKKMAPKLDALTAQQISISERLSKAATSELEMNLIDEKDFNYFKNLASKGMAGKLSYLARD